MRCMIDEVGRYWVRGWLERRGLVRPTGGVALFRGGRELARTGRFLLRPDVAAQNLSEADCGFELWTGSGQPLEVGDVLELRSGDGTVVVLRWTVQQLRVPEQLNWHIDRVDTARVAGWVVFEGALDKRVELWLEHEGKRVARVIADGFRPDLRVLRGDGRHTFSFDLDEVFPHSRLPPFDGLRIVEPRTGCILWTGQERERPWPAPAEWIRSLPGRSPRDSRVVDGWRYEVSDLGNESVLAPGAPLETCSAFLAFLLQRAELPLAGTTEVDVAGVIWAAVKQTGGKARTGIPLGDSIVGRLCQTVPSPWQDRAVTAALRAYEARHFPEDAPARDLVELVCAFIVDVVARWKLPAGLVTSDMWKLAMQPRAGCASGAPALFDEVGFSPVGTAAAAGWDWLIPGALLFGRAGALEFLGLELRARLEEGLSALTESSGWKEVCDALGWPVEPEVWQVHSGMAPRAVAQLPAASARSADLLVRVITNEKPGTGLGRNVAHTLKALKEAGIPSRLCFMVGRGGEFSDEPPHETAINLFHVQPDSLPLIWPQVPARILRSRNVGFFMWELSELAECQRLGVSLVDEIWTATEFTRQVFAAASRVPVHVVGHAVLPVVPSARDFRRELGLGNAFVFLYSFESNSGVERKNPWSVLAAFARASESFARPCRLVIKTTPFREGVHAAELRRVAAERADVVLVEERLPEEDYSALVSTADCYVSLHRSEGFGYTLAEALWFGKPLIATNHGGNVDFCLEEGAFLVPWTRRYLSHRDFIYEVPGAWWAEPDIDAAAKAMGAVVSDPVLAASVAKVGQDCVRDLCSLKRLALTYGQLLRA